MSFNLQEQNEENCTGTSNWTSPISRASTICCGGNENGNRSGNGNDGDNELKELKSKMATMEAKNQMLEGKLENLKLLAENRALKEENNLNKLKEENKQIREKLKETEEKANQFETTMQEMQKKMEELVKEMAIQRKVGHEKKLEEMEEVEEEEETQKVEQDGLKSNLLINPIGNGWNWLKTKAIIPPDILNAHNNTREWHYVFAVLEFTIHGQNRQNNNFRGTTMQYFEVTRMSSFKCTFWVGLSNGKIPDGEWISETRNYYDYGSGFDYCSFGGHKHPFEWPNGAIKPEWNGRGDVIGCGLLQSPENKLAIFFTGNGILMGKQIPIRRIPFDRFFPTVNLRDVSVEANFGDDSEKPFRYDIKKCPGLVFE